jgi:quinolinate synthase
MVVSYVNTSAAVKALTDVVVTSSNALKIVEQLPEDKPLLFGPDQNLGRYINQMTGRKMDLWNGGCHVHARFSEEGLLQLKEQYPGAKVLAHPECKQSILQYAEVIGSTQALLNYAIAHPEEKRFIIATESGILHEMQKACPGIEFIPVPAMMDDGHLTQCNECEYMRMITLEKLYECIRDEKNEIFVDDNIAINAIKPIQRMLEMS